MYTKDVKTKMTLREITKDALSEILKKHLSWINDEPGGEKADLSYADLSSADLSYANLSYANLRSADLDMSVFPLWCGSLDIKVDIRLSAQIAYHFCRFETADPEVQKAQKALKTLANKFHRVGNDVEKIP